MKSIISFSIIHDLFEIGRPTTSKEKNNKSEKRKYNYEDGDKMPSSKKEYEAQKRANKSRENDDESR